MWNMSCVASGCDDDACGLSPLITSPNKSVSAGVEMPLGRIKLGIWRFVVVSVVVVVVVVCRLLRMSLSPAATTTVVLYL